jgi:5-oxoprolinase (ATP-hydrolysing)
MGDLRLAGGKPGAIGDNRLIRANGSPVERGGIAQLEAAAGDILVVETPGGGLGSRI